jgi:hypothetical protein
MENNRPKIGQAPAILSVLSDVRYPTLTPSGVVTVSDVRRVDRFFDRPWAMAARAALRGLMRTSGQRPTALSPSSAHVGLRSGSAGPVQLTHYHMPQVDICGASAAWLAGEEQVRCANLKAISIRMKSVSSVAKITKAMKMVAAAKLKTVQSLQENARPFADGLHQFFQVMDDMESATDAAAEAEGKKKTSLIVAITSDRGLCGGINSGVVIDVKRLIGTDPDTQYSIMLLGDKGRDGIARAYGPSIVVSFKDVFKTPVSFTQVCVIAEDILSRSYDEIILVYNKFKSVITQEGECRFNFRRLLMPIC